MHARQVDRVGQSLHGSDVASGTQRTLGAALIGRQGRTIRIGTIWRLPGINLGAAGKRGQGSGQATIVLQGT